MPRRVTVLALCVLLSVFASLPAGAQGTPPLYPGVDARGAMQLKVWPNGYFIWTDDEGLHVRWTSAQGETHRFNGQATVQGRMMTFSPAYSGTTAVRRHGNRVFWNSPNSGGNVKLSCAI